MKNTILVSLVAAVVGLLFVAGGLVLMKVEAGLGLARSRVHTVNEHANLAALQHGTLGWAGVYASDEDRLAIWHTFPRISAMELEEGVLSSDQCLKLTQVEQFYGLGRTTTVRLCSVAGGTLIFVNQTLKLRL